MAQFGVALILILSAAAQSAFAGPLINIGTWNVANRPNTEVQRAAIQTVMETMDLDALVLVETDTDSANQVAEMLGAEMVLSSADSGGDRTAVLWQPTLHMLDSHELTGMTHSSLRVSLQPTGFVLDRMPTEQVTIYAVHLRSGEDARTAREIEAATLQADIDQLGNPNVVLAGDFNLTGTNERAWAQLGMNDPVNAMGEWKRNPDYITLHTHNTGGMDDRFDLQLVSDSLLDGAGLDYLTDSYQVVGNNGTHTMREPITTGTGAPPQVLAALVTASDHLPVIAAYDWGFVPGDANLDGVFDQWDLVVVLQSGKYLTDMPAMWIEGDWNSDGEFDIADLITALQGGGYGQALYHPTMPVSEPTTVVPALVGFSCLIFALRHAQVTPCHAGIRK